MRRKARRKTWLGLGFVMTVYGSLFQAASCTSDLPTLGEDWAISVVDTWIASYFSDQFNLPSSSFF